MSGKFKETCRHFAQGRCEWGAGCKFTHRTEPLDKPTGADWYHKKRPAPEREHERTSFDDTLTMQGVPCGGGWLRFWDEATGCHYYQNPDTGESRWETVPVKKPRQGEGSRAAPEVITIGNVPKQDRALCKFYEQGRCTRGAACQFYHAAPTVPDVQTAVQTALQAAASPMQQAGFAYHDGYDWGKMIDDKAAVTGAAILTFLSSRRICSLLWATIRLRCILSVLLSSCSTCGTCRSILGAFCDAAAWAGRVCP